MAKSYVLVLAFVLIGMSACGNKEQAEADKASKAAQQSFDSAPDASKSTYEAVKTATANNDLSKAKASLDQLYAQQLSAQQQQAVIELRQQLMIKAATAAQQGDANAAKIVEALRRRPAAR